eukprot:gene15275-15426_t
MIVRRFLSWAETASAAERAEGARALARAYLCADLPAADFAEAELALTALADDPSPLVRGALAEVFASAETAPKNLVLALAADQSTVALPILSRSPVLSDFDLIDLAASADIDGQVAIAGRLGLPETVCAVLAETSFYAAALALVENEQAHVSDASCRRLIRRFNQAELREALLARPGLSISLRYDLVQATTQVLARFVSACGWMSHARLDRVTEEAEQIAAVAMASPEKPQEIGTFVEHLADCGALRPNLLLRSLLTGSLELFQTALGLLTREPLPRIVAFQRDPKGSGFAALYRRAKLPEVLLPAFRSVLTARAGYKNPVPTAQQTRDMIALVCKNSMSAGQLSPLLSTFLQRIDADAARQIARDIRQDILASQATDANLIGNMALTAVAAALDEAVAEVVAVQTTHPVPQFATAPLADATTARLPVQTLSFEAKFIETMLARAELRDVTALPIAAGKDLQVNEDLRANTLFTEPDALENLENEFVARTLPIRVPMPRLMCRRANSRC